MLVRNINTNDKKSFYVKTSFSMEKKCDIYLRDNLLKINTLKV